MRRKYPELNNSGPTPFPRESRLLTRNKLEISAPGAASTGFVLTRWWEEEIFMFYFINVLNILYSKYSIFIVYFSILYDTLAHDVKS